MSKLAEYLNRHIIGNVFDTPTICQHFSTDRSILQLTPRLVAFPKNTTDLRKLLRFSNQLAAKGYSLPVTLRGSGLDATGAAIGQGLIISTARLNHIEEIDLRGRLVRVQPGVTLGALNQALSLHGLWLPVSADPAATIGGLIANAPKDNLSHRYGGIARYVARVEFALANGALIELSPYSNRLIRHLAKTTSSEGKLYRQLAQFFERHAAQIPTASRSDLAGYPKLAQVRTKHQWNLLPLLFGSQGTLGAITDVILQVEVLPPVPRRLAVILSDNAAALHFLRYAAELQPRTAKLYDLRLAATAAAQGTQPDFLGRKVPTGWLVLLSFDERPYKTNRKLRRCLDALPNSARTLVETPENANAFAQIDSLVSAYLNTPDGDRSPILPDVSIPPQQLPDFLVGLTKLEQTLGLDLPLFGSYLTANYQVRPAINYADLAGRQTAIAFLKQYARLVLDCGGSLTGGSPEGRVKLSQLAQTSASSTKKRRTGATSPDFTLDAAIKTIFDPYNILNPEVKLGADPSQIARHLRTQNHSGLIAP